MLVNTLDRYRPVNLLSPEDFRKVRRSFSRRENANGVSKRITQTKGIFKHAYDHGLIGQTVNFGPAFKKPSAKAFRELQNAKGDQSFTSDEIKSLLSVASVIGILTDFSEVAGFIVDRLGPATTLVLKQRKSSGSLGTGFAGIWHRNFSPRIKVAESRGLDF